MEHFRVDFPVYSVTVHEKSGYEDGSKRDEKGRERLKHLSKPESTV